MLIASGIIIAILAGIFLIVCNTIKVDNKDELKILGAFVGIIFAINLAITGISFIGASFSSYYNEIWNYKGVEVEYQMQWTTHETETYKEACGTERVYSRKDSKGRSQYTTRTKYVTKTRHFTRKHGPYWFLKDENGDSTTIDESLYIKWKNIWNNEKQIGCHKGSSAGFDRSIDGPVFSCRWDNSFEKIMPLSSIHKYKNKVRASKYSVMKFKSADEALQKQYPRPADEGNSTPVFLYGAPVSISSDDILILARTNAFLGARHQIHTILILFDSSQSMEVVSDIMNAWQGPNKNELITFAGIDKETKKVNWVKVESWLDNTTINGYITDSILGQDFNCKLYSDTLKTVVPKYWFRKEFKDFDYLNIETPTYISVIVIVLQLITAIITIIICIKNKKDSKYTYQRRSLY
jgi:hypothetical protein